MNAFLSILDSCKDVYQEKVLKRGKLVILQVNMGNLCNQTCVHCHIDAGPHGKKIMSRKIVDDILNFLKKNKGLILDITGGAPELNPNFEYFVTSARPLVNEIIVRSNLSVLFEKGKEHLPQFFKDNHIHLICSLPCYTKDNVDSQRGSGVYEKSIKALKLLNQLGYSRDEKLNIDLVYNPSGASLPPQQKELEQDYKRELDNEYGIHFNRLITITNVPIKRFKDYLQDRGELEGYMGLLKQSFNPCVLQNIMCRTFISVGFDGTLYDCDFNQALDWALKDSKGKFLTIGKLDVHDLEGREIMVGEHCFSCTAGAGSSCQGALEEKNRTSCSCS